MYLQAIDRKIITLNFNPCFPAVNCFKNERGTPKESYGHELNAVKNEITSFSDDRTRQASSGSKHRPQPSHVHGSSAERRGASVGRSSGKRAGRGRWRAGMRSRLFVATRCLSCGQHFYHTPANACARFSYSCTVRKA